MNTIVAILMSRDGLSFDEAADQLKDGQQLVIGGMDPEEVLLQEFGLEPDYFYDLMDGLL